MINKSFILLVPLIDVAYDIPNSKYEINQIRGTKARMISQIRGTKSTKFGVRK